MCDPAGVLVARPGMTVVVWVLWVVLLIAALALQSWFGVRLTPTHAVVCGLRRRAIAWDTVEAIGDEGWFGGRRCVLRAGGGRVPLRAPVMVLPGVGRRRFDHDLQTVRHVWLTYRPI